ncbi:MAG: hypothetical protein ACO37D_08830 [Rhodothermales bacterium]
MYGKEEARPKRKMGHVTITGTNLDTLRAEAEAAAHAVQL